MVRVQKLKIIAVLLVCLLIQGCSFHSTRNNGRVITRQFLKAIANRQEQKALSFLSDDTRSAVDTYCSDSSIVSCLEPTGIFDAGPLEDILFVQGDADGYYGYYLIFSQEAYEVVVEVFDENGHLVIERWWGFEPSAGEFSGELIEGTNRPNVFPPP